MTTKQCPNCGSTALGEMSTLFLKICGDCGLRIPWPLDKKQKPLLHGKDE